MNVSRVLVALGAVMVAFCAEAKKKEKDEPKANHTVTDVAVIQFQIQNYNGEGDDFTGNVEIGLFGEDAPITVINFKQLCDGVKIGHRLYKYQDTPCHRVVRDMLFQCGDVVHKDGRGSISSFGAHFRDEGFKISHTSAGIVSMANQGPDTNGSQFFILFSRARYLDEYHVAFGKVLKGYDVLDLINEIGPKASTSDPLRKISIESCKILPLEKKITLTEKQMLSNDLEA